jgi:hypothetical protein
MSDKLTFDYSSSLIINPSLTSLNLSISIYKNDNPQITDIIIKQTNIHAKKLSSNYT